MRGKTLNVVTFRRNTLQRESEQMSKQMLANEQANASEQTSEQCVAETGEEGGARTGAKPKDLDTAKKQQRWANWGQIAEPTGPWDYTFVNIIIVNH